MKKGLASFAFVACVIAAVGWCIYVCAHWLIGQITSIDSDTAKTVVAAAIAVCGSFVSLALSKAYETRAVIRKDLREKKTPIYEDIVGTLYGVFFAKITGKGDPDQKKLLEFFARTTEKLTIWGSDEVLKTYGDWKTQASTLQDPTEGLFLLEGLLLKIRKDLGHRNAGIGRGDLLRLFVTDIDTVLSKAKHQVGATDQSSAGH